MSVPEHKTEVMNVLEEALKKDKIKTTVIDMTKLGLIEMTRNNIREGFESLVTQPCLIVKEEGRFFHQNLLQGMLKRK